MTPPDQHFAHPLTEGVCSADFFETEKQNPQTETLLECMAASLQGLSSVYVQGLPGGNTKDS